MKRGGRSRFSPRGKLPFPRERVRKWFGGWGKGSLVARQRARPARERPERFRPVRQASSAGAGIRRLQVRGMNVLILPVCFEVLAGYRRRGFGNGAGTSQRAVCFPCHRAVHHNSSLQADVPDGPRPELERYGLVLNRKTERACVFTVPTSACSFAAAKCAQAGQVCRRAAWRRSRARGSVSSWVVGRRVRWSRASVPGPRGNGVSVFGLRAALGQRARVSR